jgi:hypothetical protein
MSSTERRNKRLDRAAELVGAMTKEEFVSRTGFSEGQYYSWFARPETKRGRPPSVDQLHVICAAFDWSPTYIFFGEGSKTLSEVKINHAMVSRLEDIFSLLQGHIDDTRMWAKSGQTDRRSPSRKEELQS